MLKVKGTHSGTGTKRHEGASDIRFLWSDPHDEYLSALRSEFHLREVVGAESDALAATISLCRWVHGLWEHDGGGEALLGDPVAILREAQTGGAFRCVEYASVLQACLESVGVRARILALKTRDVETAVSEAGHIANEVYLAHHQRWVFVDPQFNFIAAGQEGVLNAVELREALANGLPVHSLGSMAQPLATYLRWLVPYLFYLDVPLDTRVGKPDRSRTSLMLVPPGPPEPRIMQRHWLIEDMIYIQETDVFYPQPDLEMR